MINAKYIVSLLRKSSIYQNNQNRGCKLNCVSKEKK